MPNYDNSLPIYQQVMDKILRGIVKGELAPGDKVASVRVMALYYNANPNTIQKSLSKLEEMGYLHSERTSGRYVTSDAEKIAQLRLLLPARVTAKYFDEMAELGITPHEIPNYVKNFVEEERYGKSTGN